MTSYLNRVRQALRTIDEKANGDRVAANRERDNLQLELHASIADELRRIADELGRERKAIRYG